MLHLRYKATMQSAIEGSYENTPGKPPNNQPAVCANPRNAAVIEQADSDSDPKTACSIEQAE
jgi:hypothetical protein